MNNETPKSKRPSSITLISVFAIFAGILYFYYIFQAGTQALGISNTIVFAISGVVFLVCGIGFWLMKKWAVYLFTVFAVIDQIFLLLTGKWNVMSLVVSAIVVFVGYRNLWRMY